MARELNVVRKRGGPGSVKVGLIYPSTYEASLASLAYQAMYYYINSLPDFVAERFVHERGPLGLDLGSRMSSMDVLVASVHYELDYANLVEMLEAAGVEPLRDRRRSRPPLLVGGPPAAANPAPLSDIADVVVVGDAEPLLPRLLEAAASSPERLADELAGRDGFFSAGVERVRLVRADRLPLEFHPIAQIQPEGPEAPWGRSLIVESSRGCSRLCKFCMEGNLYFPAVHRPLDQVRTIVERGLPENRTNRVTFYSLSFFDHPDADAILELLLDVGAQASLPSMRLDSLDERRLEAISRLGQRTLTIAPESGSCPLRRALGKPWGRDDLLRVARAAESAGFEALKLYYMIGLPGEGEGSASLIADEVMAIRKGTRLRLSLSVTPFMPKPHTPLQWSGMEDPSSLASKARALASALRPEGIRVDFYSERLAMAQVAIARGGREMSCPILRRARGRSWERAFSECGMDLLRLSGPLDREAHLPWSVVAAQPPERLAKLADAYWAELRGASGAS